MPKTRSDETTDAVKRTWGRRIRAAMEKERLTGAAVAKSVGVTPQVVSDWRAGRTLPTVENLLAFSRLVREPVSFLIGDRLHGRQSMEELSRRLGTRLGANRLRALEDVPDRDLCDALDLLIGRAIARAGKRR